MRTWIKITVAVGVTLAVFGIAAYVTVDAGGAGHGSYVPMILLFPFSAFAMGALGVWMGDIDGNLSEWIVPAVGILQFALYGFFIGRAWVREHTRKTAIRLAIFHASVLVLFVGFLAIEHFVR